MSPEARPGRRWFQFSLRALMVLMLVAASFCGGVVYQREVNERLRAQVEQAKAEVEEANRQLRLEKLRAALAKTQAFGVVLDAQSQLFIAQLKDTPTGRDESSKRLEELFQKTSKWIVDAADSLQDSAGKSLPQIVPASHLDSRAFWQLFQINSKRPHGDDQRPTESPKTRPEMQFDEPLIDRTIG